MIADYSFKPRWAASAAVALLVPAFLALGNWQLRRAAEKEALLALREQRARAPEIVIDSGEQPLDRLRYRHVTLQGAYDTAHQFLLDNQIDAGRAGYHVLTPLKLAGQGKLAVLINRGWVAANADRTRLPAVDMAPVNVSLHGIAEKFPEVAWRLTGAEIPTPGWPAVVQLAEPGALSERLGYAILPYQVLLSPAEPHGYVRNWKPGNIDPGRNRGYALQWFAFAAVLAGLFVWHGLSPTGGRNGGARARKVR